MSKATAAEDEATGRGERWWPVASAVVVAAVLHVALPAKYRVDPCDQHLAVVPQRLSVRSFRIAQNGQLAAIPYKIGAAVPAAARTAA